ncbi:Sodium/calcium exchanger 2 [Symbiodinium microadriaticum]|uniref:Sodium/calcium exchanger 2 n=1 Tax=Symbiodinium microadriaticum TaxID=2951 RepID=A0A1Q9E0E6_SYMMI|nr:Sodium/calcium exchanger 2 [Symbiodinium microadriaticum]
MSDKALSRVVPAPDGDPIAVAVSKPEEAPGPDDDEEDDDSGSKDILQFTTSIYFVEVEKEDTLMVDVMRLGKMEDTIKVKYYTEDGSAKAGVSYTHTEGELVFPPGEYRQSIEIEVVKNPRWAPTLEYKVQLADPVGCNLGVATAAADFWARWVQKFVVKMQSRRRSGVIGTMEATIWLMRFRQAPSRLLTDGIQKWMKRPGKYLEDHGT